MKYAHGFQANSNLTPRARAEAMIRPTSFRIFGTRDGGVERTLLQFYVREWGRLGTQGEHRWSGK